MRDKRGKKEDNTKTITRLTLYIRGVQQTCAITERINVPRLELAAKFGSGSKAIPGRNITTSTAAISNSVLRTTINLSNFERRSLRRPRYQ